MTVRVGNEPNKWAGGAVTPRTRDRIAELETALARYGQHDADCRTRIVPPAPCSCGLAAALAEGDA